MARTLMVVTEQEKRLILWITHSSAIHGVTGGNSVRKSEFRARGCCGGCYAWRGEEKPRDKGRSYRRGVIRSGLSQAIGGISKDGGVFIPSWGDGSG